MHTPRQPPRRLPPGRPVPPRHSGAASSSSTCLEVSDPHSSLKNRLGESCLQAGLQQGRGTSGCTAELAASQGEALGAGWLPAAPKGASCSGGVGALGKEPRPRQPHIAQRGCPGRGRLPCGRGVKQPACCVSKDSCNILDTCLCN